MCASEKTEFLFEAFECHGRQAESKGETFALRNCKNCGVVFIADVSPDKAFYEKFYRQDYYPQDPGNPVLKGLLSLMSDFSIRKKVRAIKAALGTRTSTKVRILDIGCGKGDFLSGLNPEEFERHGQDVNPRSGDRAEKQGIDICRKPIPECGYNERSFDIVTMWHVLEHIADPAGLLLEARRLLAEGGVLAFAVPNTSGLGFKNGGKSWFHLDAPRHLIHFNERSVRFLLEKTGFKIKRRISTWYDYPLDLFWSLRDRKDKILYYVFYPVLKLFSPETLLFICQKTA